MKTLLQVAVLSALICGSAMADEPPAVRVRQFNATTADAAIAWQDISREILVQLFKIGDLSKANIPLEAQVTKTTTGDKYTRYDVVMNSTRTRKMNAVLTIPNGGGPFPAVVVIHGHYTDRNAPYDVEPQYHQFGKAFAESGYVTISTDVGQHDVYEEGRILMGERLWDVMRTVDYLTQRGEVDSSRIGVAGFSLGGEMAMWLGAMDSRIQATVTAGYLTTMDHMAKWFHCPCWKFDGLVENFDWADIYSLIAPKPLLTEIGKQDPFVAGFPLSIAKPVMDEVMKSYHAFNADDQASLFVHDGGHEFIVNPALAFMEKALKDPARCSLRR